jgi:hypothetical protein
LLLAVVAVVVVVRELPELNQFQVVAAVLVVRPLVILL